MDLSNHRFIEPEKYSKLGIKYTHYLAFKYIPSLIKKYVTGTKALDYGCGSGRSTRFLNALNLDVEGVDIDENMVKEAHKLDELSHYYCIKSASLPAPDNQYDLIFSTLVMLKVPTKEELKNIFSEIHRVLKNNGVFIFVSSSTKMYNNKWLSLETGFEENKTLKSGSLAKVLFKDINLVIRDYFWTSEDYQEIITKSNFNLVEKIYLLGDESDGFLGKQKLS